MPDSKRIIDVTLCVGCAPVVLPLALAVAVMVRVSSPGPVLHRAVRIGWQGTPFTLLKFRTMYLGVDGPGVTAADDSRITQVGRWLRRTKLDELPQLINVIHGDMSLVGPRPEDPAYVEIFHEQYQEILSVRPGVTGPAAVKFRNEEALLAVGGSDAESVYLETVLPAKIALDLDYVRRQSLWLDVSVLFATARALFGQPAVPNSDGKSR